MLCKLLRGLALIIIFVLASWGLADITALIRGRGNLLTGSQLQLTTTHCETSHGELYSLEITIKRR